MDIFGMIFPGFGQIVFFSAAGLAILGSVMMITRNNAVHSALWLVLTFFQLAVMYVMLGAEFLAALQVLVYTGAIVVLFLFVIMLLGLRESGPHLSGIHTAQLVVAWPIGLILAAQLVLIILLSNQPPQAAIGDVIGGRTYVFDNAYVSEIGGNVQAIGQTLYTQFLFPFEVASLILLLAVLGAVVLARKEEPSEVEDMMPSVGISLGRRSASNSPQEAQIEKKLLPALGARHTSNMGVGIEDVEMPTVEQPSGQGAGTTSGIEVEGAGRG